MFKADISIVIVNYNVRDYLYKCLKSIEESVHDLILEIIVVDNNSQDDSVNFLKPHFPKVQFIESEKNLGFSKANNLGFDFADGKYLLILNPDTILQKDTLAFMYDYMENHNEVGIAGCKVLNADGSFQSTCRRGFPTPWASFCKLFGLQALFPKSKLFGRYNQTFKLIDETSYTEVIAGSFMFSRTDVIKKAGGFDNDFFMYGEDIDLCYRVYKSGYKIAYVHGTSIIHYKGESTKRSSFNEIKIFYNAMEIFIKKHYSTSKFLVWFLNLGIKTRSFLAYAAKYRKDLLLIALDSLFAIIGMLIGTLLKFGSIWGFQDYAYPTVFIVLFAVLVISMVFTGEYFEKSGSVASSIFGYTLSFLILSTLTYFFKEYGFSRGVLLITIGFGIFCSTLLRLLINILNKNGISENINAIFVGNPSSFNHFLDDFYTLSLMEIKFAGYVANSLEKSSSAEIPWLGSINHLNNIINDYKINHVLITDPELSSHNSIAFLSKSANRSVKFHIVNKYEQFVASQIINKISDNRINLQKYNLNLLRYKINKRLFDILSSILLLCTLSPIFLKKSKNFSFRDLLKVLIGEYSMVGLKPPAEEFVFLRKGIISLVDLSNISYLTNKSIAEINEYYLKNYSVSIDIEILVKYLFKK